MRDSLPSARYSPVCNVLRQWKTSLIPTYRVYRLYDMYILYEYGISRVDGQSCRFFPTLAVESCVVFSCVSVAHYIYSMYI